MKFIRGGIPLRPFFDVGCGFAGFVDIGLIIATSEDL
jgi:hypothetical protein